MALGAGRAAAQDRPAFKIERTPQPPRIDGVLDDEAWQREPLELGEWLSYNPNRGDKMPPALRTEVRIAYDDRNLYFAFHCIDNEPDKIRTNVARRDSAFNDDWVAISLDSANTGQTAYHLFESERQPDGRVEHVRVGRAIRRRLVWYSVGKIVPDGYVIEMQVPLQSLRFSSGDNVKMGILFFRKVSRIGISYSWPTMPPGQWVFDRHARLQFDRLVQPRLVEALPSVTYAVNQARATTDSWDRIDDNAELGLSGKFGITSNITLDGTINPDFSQVESDAFQVEVNQRFPVFFSEKRPFFMEGMGLFNLAGTGGDGNMRTAVHTRTIVNPMWGSQDHRHSRQDDLRRTQRARRKPAGYRRARDIDCRQQQAFHHRPRDLRAERCQLHRRDRHRHRARGAPQPGGWRGRPVQAATGAHDQRLVSGVAHRHRCGRQLRQCRASVVQLRNAPLRVSEPVRTLRPPVPDGYGVLQPDRLHLAVVEVPDGDVV